jgi:hypothetical protein
LALSLSLSLYLSLSHLSLSLSLSLSVPRSFLLRVMLRVLVCRVVGRFNQEKTSYLNWLEAYDKPDILLPADLRLAQRDHHQDRRSSKRKRRRRRRRRRR